MPMGKVVEVESGMTLLESAGLAGITINNLCGGDGVCGRCKMRLRSGVLSGDSDGMLSAEDINAGIVLGCRSLVESDLEIEIPEGTHVGERAEMDQLAERFVDGHVGTIDREYVKDFIVSHLYVQLDQPSLDSNFSDFERLEGAIGKVFKDVPITVQLEVLKELPIVLRGNDYAVTAVLAHRRGRLEVIDVKGGNRAGHNYVVILDVGTTTVVAHLIDTVKMATISHAACFNSQSVYGREVTARIMTAEKKGVAALQSLIVKDINSLIGKLTEGRGIDHSQIYGTVCAGNTTMMHFLMGLPVEHIRRSPFIAAVSEAPLFRAEQLGLCVNPRGMVFVVPGIGSWVGGDLTAGILASGLHRVEKVSMLIDVGTNGEIIIGNKDWLMGCSASTGPALEGASVECGMMGENGAIEKVSINNGVFEYRVIGNCEPRGICGSGIIDLVAVLLEMGIIDRAGKFVEGSHAQLDMSGDSGRFTLPGTDVYILQADIDNIITAKAAVFAAEKIMLDRMNLGFDDLDRVFLAGGFGGFIDIRNAQKIGLLPGVSLERIQYMGNTSLYGAKLAGFSAEVRGELHEIRLKTTYYDLMGSHDYVEQFRQAMFLPHTDMELFRR